MPIRGWGRFASGASLEEVCGETAASSTAVGLFVAAFGESPGLKPFLGVSGRWPAGHLFHRIAAQFLWDLACFGLVVREIGGKAGPFDGRWGACSG